MTVEFYNLMYMIIHLFDIVIITKLFGIFFENKPESKIKSVLSYCLYYFGTGFLLHRVVTKKMWTGFEPFVQQLDGNGAVIREFPSAISAARYYSISYEGIRMCCYGKCKTSGGRIWRYKEA